MLLLGQRLELAERHRRRNQALARAYDCVMSLYGQQAEADLLATFITRLDCKTVIDVGAEHGAFADALLRAGSDAVHLFEPEPVNAALLRKRFARSPQVTVHECAVSDEDGELQLHVSIRPGGEPLSFGHTVLERPDTDQIAWGSPIAVRARSLSSLLRTGDIPDHVGVLKIDTEGHDLAVVRGTGALASDVVMVEHWSDLPDSLGPCPWSAEELVSVLRAQGYSHFAFIVHRGEFVILQWDDSTVPVGSMGNLVFVHDSVLERLLPCVLESASALTLGVLERAEMYASAAWERLAVIENLVKAASNVPPAADAPSTS